MVAPVGVLAGPDDSIDATAHDQNCADDQRRTQGLCDDAEPYDSEDNERAQLDCTRDCLLAHVTSRSAALAERTDLSCP